MSPRSQKKLEYKNEKRRFDHRNKSRSFIEAVNGFDLFASPVMNFNVRGREKVTSKFGLAVSFFLYVCVFYFSVTRIIQFVTYGDIQTYQNLDIGHAAGLRVNITDQLTNMAFLATSACPSSKCGFINLNLWKAHLVTKDAAGSINKTEIPLKRCGEIEVKNFSPTRLDHE